MKAQSGELVYDISESKQQSWDLNPGSLTLKSSILTTVFCSTITFLPSAYITRLDVDQIRHNKVCNQLKN
jgi:hypothetical protein